MPNTPEFESLITEAKVLVGAWWGILPSSEVTFQRPHVIHPRTRQGLDALVAAGYLTVEPLNRHKDSPLTWKPTAKLRSERPKVSRAFMEQNTFPIKIEE